MGNLFFVDDLNSTQVRVGSRGLALVNHLWVEASRLHFVKQYEQQWVPRAVVRSSLDFQLVVVIFGRTVGS